MTAPPWAPMALVILLAMGVATPVILPPVHHTMPTGASGLPPPHGLSAPAKDPLRHVVYIVMENHDYDSFFGSYCRALSVYCSNTGNGVPAGTCVPKIPTDPSFGCIAPYNLTDHQLITSDLNHDWNSGPAAYNGGAMNGFWQAEGMTNLSFGHYNAGTIPIYWDMAEEYASSDNFFAANLSYSLPNHWYLIAGQTPPVAFDTWVKSSADMHSYRTQANTTSTIEQAWNSSSVTWKYYDFPLGPQSSEFNSTGWGSAYDLWNPMAGKSQSYETNFSSHFVNRDQIITDLGNGSLPNVSWVIPPLTASDHPGYNVTYGEEFAAQMVDAIESSSYWNSTAIVLTWDDYGGWYDHVAPPTVLGHLLSFRSPLIVISPYAKENYISHVQLDAFSLLRFLEWQFNLPCLTALDCLAPLPLDLFDFSQAPRAPLLFPTVWVNSEYPLPLQEAGVAGLPCPGCLQSTPWSWQNGALQQPGLDVIDPS